MSQISKIQRPQDIVAILWRRKWQAIIPAAVIFAASIVIALAWPRTFRSQATILIEEPEISGDVLGSAGDYRPDQRVQVITQQVLSRQNLMKLIEKFNLYPESRDNAEPGDTTELQLLAANMREKINVNFISAEVSDPRMVRPGQTTIAFTLSFDYENPQMAQTIVNELVSLYLAENERTRHVKATETTDFLAKEAEKLANQITEQENKLADFKLKNAGSLPEEVSVNQQAMYRIEVQLLDLRQQIQSQQERQVYLESQLTQVSPYASITLNDGTVLRPEDRLKKLESQYSELSYTYGPKHPTMVGIATEIENLKKKLGVGALGSAEKPSNPAYIQLQAELKAVKSNLSSLKSEQADLTKRYQTLQSQTLKAPDIEREYQLMTRNHENATAEYRAIKEKLWEAERQQKVEVEKKGERFSVIEPAEVPLMPIAPRRRLLALVGLMIAAVGGLGTAAIAETLDQSVSSRRQLTAIAGVPPLVVIPYIETGAGKHRAWGMPILVVCGLTAVFVGGLLAVNAFVMPLDDLWARFGPGRGPI